MNNIDSRSIRTLCEQSLSGHMLTRDEIVSLLSVKDVQSLEILRQASEEALRRSVGECVRPMFFLPVSTFCEHNCSYCDYRSSNSEVHRFRLAVKDVIDVVSLMPSADDAILLLDGAQDSSIDLPYVESLFDALKHIEELPELVFAFGERTSDYYEAMKSFGMSNYVIDQKTVSPILYQSLHPQQNYYDIRNSIDSLKELNVNVGTSMVVGFPKQDLWDIADDLISIRDSDLATVIVEPFIPGTTSPLADSPRGTIQSTLNTIAVARLILKEVFIPAGLSFGILDSGSPVEALRWGADGVMLYLQPGHLGGGCTKSSNVKTQPDFDYVATRVCSLGRVMNS